MSNRKVFVKCVVFGAAFSGERVVQIKMYGGETYEGIVPKQYCWNADKQNIEKIELPQGESVTGFVSAKLVANGGDKADVAVPDGQTIAVSTESLSAA